MRYGYLTGTPEGYVAGRLTVRRSTFFRAESRLSLQKRCVLSRETSLLLQKVRVLPGKTSLPSEKMRMFFAKMSLLPEKTRALRDETSSVFGKVSMLFPKTALLLKKVALIFFNLTHALSIGTMQARAGERDRPGRSRRRPADGFDAPKASPNFASVVYRDVLGGTPKTAGETPALPTRNCTVPAWDEGHHKSHRPVGAFLGRLLRFFASDAQRATSPSSRRRFLRGGAGRLPLPRRSACSSASGRADARAGAPPPFPRCGGISR